MHLTQNKSKSYTSGWSCESASSHFRIRFIQEVELLIVYCINYDSFDRVSLVCWSCERCTLCYFSEKQLAKCHGQQVANLHLYSLAYRRTTVTLLLFRTLKYLFVYYKWCVLKARIVISLELLFIRHQGQLSYGPGITC